MPNFFSVKHMFAMVPAKEQRKSLKEAYTFTHRSKASRCPQSVTGCLRLALVFMGGGAPRGGGLIAVLGKFLASIDKIFIFAGGRWALGYHSMGFRHFPMVLGRSATRETTSTHHVYK